MKFSYYNLFSLLCLPAVTLWCGCSSPEPIPEDYGHVKFKRPDKVVYEQIPTAGCILDVPADLHAVSGTPLEMEVQLINNSRRSIVIKEWYMIDQYNFNIFYRRLPSDKPADPQTPFKRISVRIPANPPPRHAELQLKPGNRAALTVTLPFTGDLNPGEEAMFEVAIATSLNTFKLQSKRFMVYAR